MNIGFGIYTNNSIAAVALYRIVFRLELGYHVKNPDGTFYHAELCRDDNEVFSVVQTDDAAPAARRVQLCLEFDDEAEVRRAFSLLQDGGEVDLPPGPLPWSPCAASVIDRFGVWWYFAARSHRPDDDFDPTKPLDIPT